MDDVDELLHRAKLKHYLSEEELLLPDKEREKLLIQRELLDSGLLRDPDLIGNEDQISRAAMDSASKRNGTNSWLEENWIVILVIFFIALGVFLGDF